MNGQIIEYVDVNNNSRGGCVNLVDALELPAPTGTFVEDLLPGYEMSRHE